MLENDLSPSVENTTIYLKDYQPPNYLVDSVKLDFVLAEVTTVTASINFRRNGGHVAPLILDGEKMKLISVAVDGQQLTEQQYTIDDKSLTINQVPEKFTLNVVTQLLPQQNTELSGLYQSSGNFCTQCEAEGFRRITYFPDRPDVLAVYEVKITADKTSCPILLSNGNPSVKGDNDDGTHWQRWVDPHPKPSYLFALVAGNLERIEDQFTTMNDRVVDLHIYTQAHNIDKCDHAMESLKNSMRWDEEAYGREYDLDIYNIVAVDDFNMGAMENKGLNIFNSKYVLADQNSATDTDYDGIESVIGHEYFHNWSGNRVTCRDWFQLSLKEGFTVFRDQEFSASMGSSTVKRIRDVQTLRAHQFKEDAGPMAHSVRPDSYQEINNFYTVTIYEKGAEVIRMMNSLVGDDGFRKGTDLYFGRFDGQAVTTEDFVRCIEEANNIDLSQFRLWYTQSGTPHISVKQQFNSENGVVTLTLTQSCPDTPGQLNKQPFHIPIKLALLDENGQEQEEVQLDFTEVEQTFEFDEFQAPPVVSFLRDFSASIMVEFEQSNAELAHLIKYDNNGFARWEAVQRLSLNIIIPTIKSDKPLPESFDEEGYKQLKDALLGLIDDAPSDKAMLAEMLSLPTANYITELVKPIDPIKVFAVRQQLYHRLAQDLQTQMLELYDENHNQESFSLDAEAKAKRSLKNIALAYLVDCKKSAYYQLAVDQYHNASNMTDRLAAFVTLMHSNYSGVEDVIEDFYRQWHGDTLVLDKWFAIQATMPKKSTLSAVVLLLEHKSFSINNPNKVRSLIGAFCSNLSAFHQVDGAGYEFLADRILELNTINPQVAARLVSVFNNWRSFASPNKELMQTQLQRINESNDLKRDVREIVSKALL